MARFAADPAEIQHLIDVQDSCWDTAGQNGWKLKAVLMDGSSISGHFAGIKGTNNGGDGGFWAYAVEVTIKDEKGTEHTIDCLDVDSISSP